MPNPQPKTHAAACGSSNHEAARHAVSMLTDQVDLLTDVQQAFEAVERLVTPMQTGCERLELDRSELGALFRVLNRGMREQLTAACELAKQAREATR